MMRVPPCNLTDEFDDCPVFVNSVPPTPSPSSASHTLADSMLQRLPARSRKAPPALNEELFDTAGAFYTATALLPACEAYVEPGFNGWSMPLGLPRPCAESVSLGHVEAGTGQATAQCGVDEGMVWQPPSVFLQLPPPSSHMHTEGRVTTGIQLPPPPALPPQLFPGIFAEPPPAPAHLPDCLETGAEVEVGAGQFEGRATVESDAAQSRSDKFFKGSGSLLAQQLAQQLSAEIVRSELKVKNTFIDSGMTRSPSLERVLQEGRQVRSCPGSALPTPRGKYAGTKFGINDLGTVSSSRASTVDTSEPPESLLEDTAEQDIYAAGVHNIPSLQAAAWRHQARTVVVGSSLGDDLKVRGADHRAGVRLQLEHAVAPDKQKQGRKARVLQLEHVLTFTDDDSLALESDDSGVGNLVAKSDADPDSWADSTLSKPPRLGSAELPSIGSLGHHMRRCRPCAFVLRTGCSNGTQCNFCHLCNAGEKKRRRKEKRALIGAARRLALAEPCAKV